MIAAVMLQYHPLIAWSKTSLHSSRDLHGGCGGGFVIRLHLLPLISGQGGSSCLDRAGDDY